MQKPIITYADFDKLDIRIGTIVGCNFINGSEKLLNLTVDLGAELGMRTILSGIKKYFEPEKLIGTQVLVLANLEPKKMMARLDRLGQARQGIESQGMILMGVEKVGGQEGQDKQEGLEKIALLVPQEETRNGTEVE